MALHPMKRIGIENRAKIIEFMRAHLGANYKDIARGTGLTVGCVRDHVLQIKAEWRAKCGWQASTLKHGAPIQLSLFNLSEHEAATRGSPQLCSKPKASEDSKPSSLTP